MALLFGYKCGLVAARLGLTYVFLRDFILSYFFSVAIPPELHNNDDLHLDSFKQTATSYRILDY